MICTFEKFNLNFRNPFRKKIQYNPLDPYGEEDWNDEDLTSNFIKRLEKDRKSLNGILVLECAHQNLSTITGINKLKNLRALYCNNNQLINLDGIEDLNKLRSLCCYDNPFSDQYKNYLINYCREKKIILHI